MISKNSLDRIPSYVFSREFGDVKSVLVLAFLGHLFEKIYKVANDVRICIPLDVPNMKERLLRYWAYFRRGHNVYLYFFMSFLNFLVIQWTFLISTFDPLATLLQNLLIFSTVFLLTYIPLSTIIGWIDFKRGAVPVDQTIGAQANPWYQDLAKAILLLAEGKNQEVIEVMKKWVKKETR